MKFIVKKYNRNSEEKPPEEHFVNQKQAESYIESLVKKAEKEGKIVYQTFQNDLVQGHNEPYGLAYRTINQIDEYRIASTKEDILDGGDVEMLSLYETEAEDIDDACSLTHAWLNDKSIESILAHAQSHIDDISLYNPEHPAIPLIKKLVKKTEELNREIDQVCKELF